jgi:coenzyme F420 biosynthesis associated uncharacterized protein
MAATPRAELLVVDRHAWIGGNVSTLQHMIGDIAVAGAQSKIVAWEGGAFLGMLARLVLAQYDPFRDQLIVVYPNLGEFSDVDGLRWLVLHEVTHVAQFRAAPWIGDRIVEVARQVLDAERSDWTRDAWNRMRERMPDILRWAREALEGRASGSPLLDLLPDEQREAIMSVNALVTLLEGHATHITELAAKRVVGDLPAIERRVNARRKRPAPIRLLEAVAGIQMKRQQYIAGKKFCEEIWKRGGAEALAPAWRGPEWAPTMDELQAPQTWLARVGAHSAT